MSNALEPKLSVVPKGWPAFVALAAVVAMSLVVVVIDLAVDRQTADQTAKLVDDALRSVTLVEDMRSQAHALAVTRDPQRRAAILAQLGFDVREYDPLADFEGERAEWLRLQELLSAFQREQLRGTAPTEIPEIEASVDRIVEINRRQAASFEASISEAHRQGIVVNATGGVITLMLAVAIGLWLLRAIHRQRSLLHTHLAMLDDRSRELEAFAGRVAHDLRGPLSPLRGYADLLAEQVPAARPTADRIGQATDRMSSIIDDLLSLSVSGHPGPGETAVAPIVREVVDELGPTLAEADLALELADCAAQCSPSVLHQLVGNLVSNAIKYRSPARPLELAISCATHDDMVEVEIADNGIGMDEDAASHAFEPFYRARTARVIPGHGLGLAIVKRTVDALGGTCVLASEVDRGTRVTLRLPAAHAA